jgi:RES domain
VVETLKPAPDRVWRRVYGASHPGPLGFGCDSSRFSDPRTTLIEADRFGVLYLGASLKVCFLEAILRDKKNGRLGDLPISYSELTGRVCADIELREPLSLVDLRGDNLVKMGVPTDAVRSSSHKWGARWSLAFWSHSESPDGLIYSSRLNEETNIALYDRAIRKVAVRTIRPLLDCGDDLAAIIREFKLSIKR